MKEFIAKVIYEALRQHGCALPRWSRLTTEQREYVIAQLRQLAPQLESQIVPPPLPEGPGGPPVGP